MKNSDIYSIVFQLSADLANGKLKADAPRAQGILNNPTQTSNAHAFWQSMFAQLLLGGECFAYRWRNQNGTDMTWERFAAFASYSFFVRRRFWTDLQHQL